MKLAHLTCHHCKLEYEQVLRNSDYYAVCPTCGQANTLAQHLTENITGRCLNCNGPLDDHIWQGEIAVHCP